MNPRAAVQQTQPNIKCFRKMASEIFVLSDLVDQVFANEQPAGYRQEDSRFPEISETDLNAIMEGNQNTNTNRSTST